MKSTNTFDASASTDGLHVSLSTSSTFTASSTAVITPSLRSSSITPSKLSSNSRDVGPRRIGSFAGQKHFWSLNCSDRPTFWLSPIDLDVSNKFVFEVHP